MLEDIIIGIIYRAAHEYQERIVKSKDYNGWWCNGYGFMFQPGHCPPHSHLFWDADECVTLLEEELGIGVHYGRHYQKQA